MSAMINDGLGDRTLKNKLTTILPLFLLAIGAIDSVTSANAGLIDSIYVPLEAPCRVGDTRGTSTPTIPADGHVEWDAYGVNVSSQGGEATGCPQPKIGKTPTAIAVNITAAANGAATTRGGNLVAYAADAIAPTTSVVNYTPGTNIANSTIVGLSQDGKFIIQSNFAEVRAIADVQGYFYAQTGGNGHVPVEDYSYVGSWSGRMLYDRRYTGDSTCHDADATIRVIHTQNVDHFDSIIIRRDAGGIDITKDFDGYMNRVAHLYADLSNDGYVATTFNSFDRTIELSLQFSTDGSAVGDWVETNEYPEYSDCYGTWSLTRD